MRININKRSLVIVALTAVTMASCACGTTEETTKKATTQATTEEDKTASETGASADDELATTDFSTRNLAEGYIGKTCVELWDAIGSPIECHPIDGKCEDGMYHGYLHYDGFDVEYVSEDDSFEEEGVGGCTVYAVTDSKFDY